MPPCAADGFLRAPAFAALSLWLWVASSPALTARSLGCLQEGGNPDSNTLISDMATVICLDDYHALDRNGRKKAGVTALAPEAQAFDLMYEQVRLGQGVARRGG